MRQLAGYILPGGAMLAFGVKWGVQVALEQMEQQRHSYATISSSEASSTSGWSKSKKQRRGGGGGGGGGGGNSDARRRSCSWRLRRVPAEGVIKLSITGLGIAASVASATPSSHTSQQPVGDMLYASIYMFFALSGLADVLVHYCPLAVPSGLDRLTLALAFGIEGLMFHLHLAREALLEQHVHFLLVVSIYACATCCLIEAAACSPHPFLWRFARALFSVLHGSWFVHSAFLLHRNGPDATSPQDFASAQDFNSALVWVSLAFAWHCAGALVLLLALLFLCRCCCRRPRRPRDCGSSSPVPTHGPSAPCLPGPSSSSCSSGLPPPPLPASSSSGSCPRCLPPSHLSHPHSLPHPLPPHHPVHQHQQHHMHHSAAPPSPSPK